ncbi:MAG: CDP-diacylglycerol--serine O-phosphatidyltransferase [Firmicutes bacterium]|nr:CDP-diacylglycerol--serine O-phosphatidyltransferase [Bacillota bacterium]
MSHGHKRKSTATLLRKNLPNFLTLLNMLSGLVVVYLSIGQKGHNYAVLSCILILIAAGLDTFDGAIARLVGAESDFGKQLDSFADLISFGIAPVAVLLTVEAIAATPALLFILVLYPAAGAFRLARFNLGNYTDHFEGLPITAAGFTQACFILLLCRVPLPAPWTVGLTALLTALLSILMVSTFKIGKIKLLLKGTRF